MLVVRLPKRQHYFRDLVYNIFNTHFYREEKIVQRAIVKIDLVGSKSYMDKAVLFDPKARVSTLQFLYDRVREIFPYADQNFPEGTFYDTQGDCAYLIIEKPTVALRATIDFMRVWFGAKESLPDCRAVIDFSGVDQIEVNGRIDATSQAFEDISQIEKDFGAGEIAVTEILKNRVDPTLVQFGGRHEHWITEKRPITTYLARYDDPRLLQDSSLVQALFVSSHSAEQARFRAIEATVIEAVVSNDGREVSFDDLRTWFENHNLPTVSTNTLREIADRAVLLKVNNRGRFYLDKSAKNKVQTVREQFNQDRKLTVDKVSSSIADSLKIESADLDRKIAIVDLIEEYLCAVFLELRMMANFFKSTQTLFERLSAGTEYDYILRRRTRDFIGDSNELFLKFKTAFLKALQIVTNPTNRYIAAIFHNVLMLYYLNHNPNYIAGQIEKLRKKRYHWDTNVLYAYKCRSSQFHTIAEHTLKKLRQLGANVTVYKRSVKEYQDSLRTTFNRSKKNNGAELALSDRRPWIWEEYNINPSSYAGNFEYCVAVHQIPKGETSPPDDWYDAAKQELGKEGIEIVEMKSWKDYLELGELYEDVHKSKRRYNSEYEYWEGIVDVKAYEDQVLHDANCLIELSCKGSSPFETDNVFVTCDFKLANIRKKRRGEFPFLVTITEFYEFMMPYLLVADAVGNAPVELPNSLLAGAISEDLASTGDYYDSLRRQLSTDIPVNQDNVILSRITASEQFKRVKKHAEADILTHQEVVDFGQDLVSTMHDYDGVLNDELKERLFRDEMHDLRSQVSKLEEEKKELERRLATQQNKANRRDKYIRRQKKQE